MSRKYRVNQRLRLRSDYIRSALTGCFFGLAVIGLIYLTNAAASRMQQSSTARLAAEHATTRANTADTSGQAPDLATKQTLQPIPTKKTANQPAASGATPSDDATPARSNSRHSSCKLAARQHILSNFTKQLAGENAKHKSLLSAVERTGLVTQLLNPDMFSLRISAENLRHEKAVKSLTRVEVSQLAAIHCER